MATLRSQIPIYELMHNTAYHEVPLANQQIPTGITTPRKIDFPLDLEKIILQNQDKICTLCA